MSGSELYQRQIVANADSDPHGPLMLEVWQSTPWMVDAYTGSCASERDYDIIHWCYDHFGQQAMPLHGKGGDWQRGGATIYGWTWMGFATQEQMDEFLRAWPTPDDAARVAKAGGR